MEGQLIMVRMSNSTDGTGNHYNTWIRVKFVDTDGLVHGIIERVHYLFVRRSKDDNIIVDKEQALRVYEEGQQWCYDDSVTVCDCPGLCRNKM